MQIFSSQGALLVSYPRHTAQRVLIDLRCYEGTVETARALGTPGSTLDEADLRRALAELTPLWAVMQLGERQRVLRLLIERVTYTAALQALDISFRSSGVVTLTRELAALTPRPRTQGVAP